MKIISLREWLLTLQLKGTEKEIRQRLQEDLALLTKKPLISCLLPIDQANQAYLRESIDSVLNQSYHWFELCIICYGVIDSKIQDLLKTYQQADSRVKLCPNNLENRQFTLDLAKGEYFAILNQHDSLSQDALYEMVRKIHLHPEADLIYSDEDEINQQGSFVNPLYKPDWCPDSFLSRNYIRHLTLIRSDLIVRAGGLGEVLTKNFEYDLLLRVTELTDHIVHIHKVLYHHRPESTEVGEEDLEALIHAMQRRNANALVEPNPHCSGCYTVSYQLTSPPKVSIIIPTKDQTTILKKCIDSIYSKTDYQNFELIVVSNNSTDKNLFYLLQEYKKTHNDSFFFYESNIPFNYSKLMNDAVSFAKGGYLLFLNNDTELISGNWIKEMVGQAGRASIGVVGCKLLYTNNTIQHAGVVLGQKNYLGIHTFIGEERNASSYFSWLNTINNYSAVTAACMLCRRTVFNEVNGFDEELEVDCNDLDFCLKLKERGYHNIYLPHVELYHHESLTRGDPRISAIFSKQYLKAQKIIRTRWAKYLEYDPCYSMHLSEKGNFTPVQ